MRTRRYYLLSRVNSRVIEDGLEPFWQGKQLAEPSTALPSDFPFPEERAAAGYLAVEDLDGADEDELVDAGLDRAMARIVIDRFCALTAGTY